MQILCLGLRFWCSCNACRVLSKVLIKLYLHFLFISIVFTFPFQGFVKSINQIVSRGVFLTLHVRFVKRELNNYLCPYLIKYVFPLSSSLCVVLKIKQGVSDARPGPSDPQRRVGGADPGDPGEHYAAVRTSPGASLGEVGAG